MSQGDYIDVTSEVLQKYQGLWFVDESFKRRQGGLRGFFPTNCC